MTLRSLLVANFDFIMGGGEVGLLMLAEGLADRGHRPMVAVPGTRGLASHLPHVVLDPTRADAKRQLAQLADAHDVVHVYSNDGVDLTRGAGVRRPVIHHAVIPNPDPRDASQSGDVAVTICNSEATAARFTSSRADVMVVYAGIAEPIPPQEPLGLDPDRRHVVIVGGTAVRKGQLDALPALLEVIDATDDVDVVLVGRIGGPAALRLLRFAGQSRGRLRLLGFVPGVANHLPEFDLVLVPSRTEGFGRVAVEAMRAGVPVLARRVEGLKEALQGLSDPWLPADRAGWGPRILDELRAPTNTPNELRSAAERFDPERFISAVEAIHLRLARSGAAS